MYWYLCFVHCIIAGEYGLPGTMGRNTTPGVTIFHQHIVSRFTVFSGDRPVKHTLEQVSKKGVCIRK